VDNCTLFAIQNCKRSNIFVYNKLPFSTKYLISFLIGVRDSLGSYVSRRAYLGGVPGLDLLSSLFPDFVDFLVNFYHLLGGLVKLLVSKLHFTSVLFQQEVVWYQVLIRASLAK